jgi:hypothetical protein
LKVKNSGFHPSVAYLILFNLSFKDILGKDNLEKQLFYRRSSQGIHGGGRAAVCAVTTKIGEISVPKGASREYFYSIFFLETF